MRCVFFPRYRHHISPQVFVRAMRFFLLPSSPLRGRDGDRQKGIPYSIQTSLFSPFHPSSTQVQQKMLAKAVCARAHSSLYPPLVEKKKTEGARILLTIWGWPCSSPFIKEIYRHQKAIERERPAKRGGLIDCADTIHDTNTKWAHLPPPAMSPLSEKANIISSSSSSSFCTSPLSLPILELKRCIEQVLC